MSKTPISSTGKVEKLILDPGVDSDPSQNLNGSVGAMAPRVGASAMGYE